MNKSPESNIIRGFFFFKTVIVVQAPSYPQLTFDFARKQFTITLSFFDKFIDHRRAVRFGCVEPSRIDIFLFYIFKGSTHIVGTLFLLPKLSETERSCNFEHPVRERCPP